jgi:hypothetical protein
MRAFVLLALPIAFQGSTLRWTPKEGDEIRYRTEAELTVPGGTATITAVNSQKVIRVDPDGSYTLQSSQGEGKVSYQGQEMEMRGVTALSTYGPNGEIKEIRSDKADGGSYRMANLTEFHAPAKAVAVGDAWTAEGKGDAKTGAVAWKAEYKVVAEETVGAYPALRMDVAARETEGNDPGKATGSVWVGRDGIPVKTVLTWSNLVVPGSPGPVNGKLTRTRL